MKLVSLSEVCKMYGFTRRVIQGYEKEGLIKHTSKNKYGYLMYEQKTVIKIGYIRYLQKNGLTLKEILVNDDLLNKSKIIELLEKCNKNHQNKISKHKELIKRNNIIIDVCSKSKNLIESEKEIMKIIMEESKWNVYLN